MFIHIGSNNQILSLLLIFISTMRDPVSILCEAYPYDPGKILASACGEAYVAIMLANGQIGVCSTLSHPVNTDPLLLSAPDLKILEHRMLTTAFANAHLNYLPENPGSGDIFDQVDFTKKQNTVMIGYFPPLVEKFRKLDIPLSAFDQHKEYPDLTPLSQLDEKVSNAGCVIITATTLINSTFTDIISKVKVGVEVYLLGPSTPLLPELKSGYSVTGLFGMTFRPFDFEILSLIGNGNGTQSFSKRSNKVSL